MTSPVESISAIATLELFLISEYSRELKSDKYRRRDRLALFTQVYISHSKCGREQRCSELRQIFSPARLRLMTSTSGCAAQLYNMESSNNTMNLHQLISEYPASTINSLFSLSHLVEHVIHACALQKFSEMRRLGLALFIMIGGHIQVSAKP